MGGQPHADQTILSGFLTGLGVDIASLQIYRSLDSRDMGINVQVIPIIGTDLSQNISGHVLRQSNLNLNIGRGSLDRIIELVLLLIQIDFLTIRSYQITVLYSLSQRDLLHLPIDATL